MKTKLADELEANSQEKKELESNLVTTTHQLLEVKHNLTLAEKVIYAPLKKWSLCSIKLLLIPNYNINSWVIMGIICFWFWVGAGEKVQSDGCLQESEENAATEKWRHQGASIQAAQVWRGGQQGSALWLWGIAAAVQPLPKPPTKKFWCFWWNNVMRHVVQLHICAIFIIIYCFCMFLPKSVFLPYNKIQITKFWNVIRPLKNIPNGPLLFIITQW